MLKSKREQFLAAFVIVAVAVFAGTYVFRNFGEELFSVQSQVQERLDLIDQMLEDRNKTQTVTVKYDAMQKELTLNGSDSEQQLNVIQDISAILKQVGLEGKYRNLTNKESQKEDDFKILVVSIEQIQCTPQQLGELLFLLEKEKNVMEVERCQIDNIVTENGNLPYRFRDDSLGASVLNGLLTVNLQIARLVEYRKGEQPTRKR